MACGPIPVSDLGIAAATGGLCQAHVIRLLSPCTDEVRKRHVHEPELQLIYVLQGGSRTNLKAMRTDDVGGFMLAAATRHSHTVLDYSADVELLEIIVPPNFKTTDAA